jgi:uncharacterized protein YkwD
MSSPSGQEQEFLELINRMRTAPIAELDLLLNSADPTTKADVDGALKYFGTNSATLRAQWGDLTTASPLAWSSELNQAAAAHNQAMIAADTQSHQVDGEKVYTERFKDAGYVYSYAGENVDAAAKSVEEGEASLAIDWGADDPKTPIVEAIDGIQNPAGHRKNLLATTLREVGISVAIINDPTKQNVGPFVVTQDFGNRPELDGKAYILGVAFDDKNHNGWYQAGEGNSDVQVTITNIATKVSQLVTVNTVGGYQQLVDPGDYQVDFSRAGVIIQTATTSISAKDPENVKLDFVVPDLIAQNNTPVTTTNVDSPTIDMVKKTVTGGKSGVDAGVLVNDLVLKVVALGDHLQNGTPERNLFDFTKDFVQTNLPDLTSKTITVDFVGVSADASYHNYAGLYRVDDAAGTIDGLKPGDSGYIIAALKRSKEAGQDVEFDRNGISTKNLKGGYIYAPFVVADGTVDQVLNSKDPAKAPHVYCNYLAANADAFDHIKSLGANKFAFEDTFGGGDKDFNDLVFEVSAKVAVIGG